MPNDQIIGINRQIGAETKPLASLGILRFMCISVCPSEFTIKNRVQMHSIKNLYKMSELFTIVHML